LKALLNQGSAVVDVKKVEETRARVASVFDIFETRGRKIVCIYALVRDREEGRAVALVYSETLLDRE